MPFQHSTRREFLKSAAAGVALGMGFPVLADRPSPITSYFQDRGWLVGCWTRPWAREDYRVAFDAIAKAGMKHVALTGAKTETGRVIAPATSPEDARQVGVEARNRGLEITHVYGGGLPLQRGSDSLRKMIDNTSAAGGWSVVISDLGNETTYELYLKAIAECCEYAEQRDVALVIKPHGGLTGTGPLCRQAIERIGHRNVTLMYDPGNIRYYSEGELDPLEDCLTIAGLVTSISAKDFRAPKAVDVTPGSGEIDFAELFSRMHQGGFTHGAALIETVSPGDAAHTLAEVIKAKEFLEKVLDAGDSVRKGMTAAGKPAEGQLDPFLGEPRFDVQRIFTGERFPNVVVAVDGTVLTTWGNKSIRVRRSEDGGETWGPEITVADPGFHGGGALVNEANGQVLVFVHDKHPPGRGETAPLTVYASDDHGKTWTVKDVTVHEDQRGYVPAMHMSEAGITLRHGAHAGRLLRPARVFGIDRGYNTAIYSDDDGTTWHSSAPFPEKGTGEGTVAELADGSIYYNSRLHWGEAERPTKRRSAVSRDGTESWEDWRIIDILPDGPQESTYGCMGGLIRLPVQGRDILIFSNLDTAGSQRERLTLWASFDGGATWPVKRLVEEGPSAYSSLSAGRPETVSEGWIYLQYESRGAQLARFNLSWLLQGDSTGDGTLPAWLRKES